MNKKLKITYSSHRNITFQNRHSPDYEDLPDDWDEYTQFEKDKYIGDILEDYIWELVELDGQEVDVEEE